MKKQYFQIQVVYLGLVSSSVILGGITYFLNQQNGAFLLVEESFYSILLIAVNILSFTQVIAGITIFNSRTSKMSKNSPADKLQIYKTSFIVRGGLIESAIMMFFIGFLIFGGKIFFYEGIIFFLLQLLYMPNKERIAQLTGLSASEFDQE